MYELRLLGSFGVSIDGRAVPDQAWRHKRGAHVVTLLALAPGNRLHREQLMDALWPDLPPSASASNLRKAVHFARRAVGSDGIIHASGDTLSLPPGAALTIDARDFEEAARAALTAGDASACAAAAAKYTGDLLPGDLYEAWTQEPRTRLQVLHVRALKSAQMWDRVLEIDRADEEAHRALMLRALESGDRGAAIRQFERLREALRVDLGVGPDSESIAIYEKALAMEGHPPPTPAQRARALIAWGLVHLSSGDLEEAERLAEEARSIAIEESLGREIGDASGVLGLVAVRKGRWPDLFRSEFIAATHRTPEMAAFVFDAHLCLAEFFLNGSQGHEQVAPYARELLEVAERAGSVQGRALATLLLGDVEMLSGRLDEAEDLLLRATKLHQEASAPSGQVMALEARTNAALLRGQRWRAARLIPRAFRLAETSALSPHLLVRMHAASVESAADEARRLDSLRRADAALAGSDVCPPCSIGYRVLAAKTLADAGRLDEARSRLEDADRVAGMWQGGPWVAAVWEARAALRTAEGLPAQAAALYREAAERFAALNRPLDVQRCVAAAAEAETG